MSILWWNLRRERARVSLLFGKSRNLLIKKKSFMFTKSNIWKLENTRKKACLYNLNCPFFFPVKNRILNYIVTCVLFATRPHSVQYTEQTMPAEQVAVIVLIFIVRCVLSGLTYWIQLKISKRPFYFSFQIEMEVISCFQVAKYLYEWSKYSFTFSS